jgi:hypothetical protein
VIRWPTQPSGLFVYFVDQILRPAASYETR